MNKKRSLLLAAAIVATAIPFTGMKAATIIGNLASYTNSSGPATTIEGGTPGAGKAIGFTMGAESFLLSSVTLRLTLDNATNDVPSVEIWTADGSNTPGSLYGTLTNPGFDYGGTLANYTFTASTSLTLNAGSGYFVVVRNLGPVSGSPTGTYTWASGSPIVTPTGSYATLLSSAIFGTGDPGSWTSTSSVYNWLQVDGAAVPEPSTVALMVGCGFWLILMRRNRRRQA